MMDRDKILIKLCEHQASRFWKVDYEKLTEAERVFILVWELESEVNNGGLNQYYCNSSGDWASGCPDALKRIGAGKAAQIIENANNLFPGGCPPKDRDERCAHVHSISDGAFDEFDQQFLKYPDDLTGVAIYLRSVSPIRYCGGGGGVGGS